MKWYLAGRIRHLEKLNELSKILEDCGQQITSSWIKESSLKPYEDNLGQVQVLADKVVHEILESDIFVLISDPAGTDMFVELGLCLAKKKISNDIKIYIAGEHSKRSLMQLHPAIIHVKDMNELFMKEGIDQSNLNNLNFK